MNTNIKRALMMINVTLLNIIFVIFIHEMLHYSQSNTIKEACFLGYYNDNNRISIGWFQGDEKTDKIFEDSDGWMSWFSLYQFLITFVLSGIMIWGFVK